MLHNGAGHVGNACLTVFAPRQVYASYSARYEGRIVQRMIQNDGGKGVYQELAAPMLGIWGSLLQVSHLIWAPKVLSPIIAKLKLAALLCANSHGSKGFTVLSVPAESPCRPIRCGACLAAHLLTEATFQGKLYLML